MAIQDIFSRFGPVQTRQIQRTRIDPFEYARQLAAEGVAREQARAQMTQALANIPSQIFQGIEEGKQRRVQEEERSRQKALDALRQKEIEASISEKQAQAAERQARAKGLERGQLVATLDAEGNVVGYVPKGSIRLPPALGSADAAKTLPKLKAMESTIKGLEQKFENLPTGRLIGLFQKGKAAAGLAPEVTSIESLNGPMRSMVARILGGEVGNLTETEQELAREALPKITDTSSEIKAKFENLKFILEARKQAAYEILNRKQSADNETSNPVRSVRILDSDGVEHTIPANKVNEARRRDSGLRVLGSAQ